MRHKAGSGSSGEQKGSGSLITGISGVYVYLDREREFIRYANCHIIIKDSVLCVHLQAGHLARLAMTA